MAMTDEQIERYSRHIILKEVGAKRSEEVAERESSDYWSRWSWSFRQLCTLQQQELEQSEL